jgi:hypothetical protein
MKRASAFHALARAAIAKLPELALALDSLRREHARLQDRYDTLRARAMMGAR